MVRYAFHVCVALGLAALGGCENKAPQGAAEAEPQAASPAPAPQAAKAKPQKGQSRLELRLSGGDLSEAIRFDFSGKVLSMEQHGALFLSNMGSLKVPSQDGKHTLTSFHCGGVEPKVGLTEPSSKLMCVFRIESQAPLWEGQELKWQASLVHKEAKLDMKSFEAERFHVTFGPEGSTTVNQQPKRFDLHADFQVLR